MSNIDDENETWVWQAVGKHYTTNLGYQWLMGQQPTPHFCHWTII